MGNSLRTRYRIKLHIYTEREVYRPGDTVRGIVYVEAKENFITQALHIRILGHEKCQWVRGSSHNQHRQANYNQFLKAQEVLTTFQKNYIQEGKYGWPFQMELPDNIPGSLSCQRFQDSEIKYQLSSFLVQYGLPHSVVETGKQIKIIEPFRLTLSPVEGSDYCEPVSCFCRPMGQVGILVNISKNVCLTGETVNIIVKLDNKNSTSAISYVLIELIQNVFMDVSVEQRTFRTILKKLRIQGVEAGKVSEQSVELEIDNSIINEGTSLGQILAKYYTIQVRPVMSKILTFDVPSVVSPLFVLKKLQDKPQEKIAIDETKISDQMQRVQIKPYRPSNNSSIKLMNSDAFPEEILQ